MTISKSTNCSDCEYCFSQNPVFGTLNEKELEIINSTRVPVSFKKGEIIYKQGMPLTHLVIIHSGFGKIYIENSKSKNLILSFTQKYTLHSGIGLFIDQIHHSSLMASVDCETCLIDINSFKEILHSNKLFMDAYIKEYSESVQNTYHRFVLLTQKNMEGRIAKTILYLRDIISDNDTIKNVSKQDLAELTAMSKESAIRVLKEFKDEGYIKLDNQSIIVLNDKSLNKIATYS